MNAMSAWQNQIDNSTQEENSDFWISGVVGTRNICIRDMALLTVQKPIAGSNPARSIGSVVFY